MAQYYLPGLAQYNSTAGWEYITADRLGSVRLLVKPNGELALSQSFDPFGNVLEQVGPGVSGFGYTGEQTDPTGLVFLRARYYDPALGRFITPDSLIPDPMRSQAWNRYAYVESNPLKFTDPSGHCFFAGIDTVACIAVAKVAIEATLLVGTIYVVNSETFQEAATEAGQAIRDSIALLTEDIFGQQTPEIKPCSLDTGFYPGPGIDVPPYEGIPPFPLIGPQIPDASDFPLNPIEWPNVLSTEDTTPGGERLTQHGKDRLFRGVDIDDVIKNYSHRYIQFDGAEVFVKRVGRNKYDVVIRGDEGVVTAMKNKSKHELDNLARNYGWR